MPNNPEVQIVLFDQFSAFEFGIVAEIFGKDRPEVGPDWYQFKTVGPKPMVMNTEYRVSIEVDGDLSELENAQLIIIPGWQAASSSVPDQLVEALLVAHARGTKILSLCNGVAVLAATGLLDGKRAASHWRDYEYLQNRYPLIQFDNEVLYVDNDDVATSAGSSAAIDLCLHQIRCDFGVRIANMVAKRTVVAGYREGGQAQFVDVPVASPVETQNMSNTVMWLEQNLHEPMKIKDAAHHARMSERTFQRRFHEAAGISFGIWLIRKRLNFACTLIEENAHHALDEIAALSGFSTLPTMQHHFRKILKVSPSQYVKNFAAKAKNQI